MNYYEIAKGIVHAPCANSNDYTLCGLTAEKLLDDMSQFAPEEEDDVLPQMVLTNKKVSCPQCAQTIRHCCHLGLKSIGKVKEMMI